MVGNSPAPKFLSPPFRTPPTHAKNNRPCQGFESHLGSRQPRDNLKCLHDNVMWNNFLTLEVNRKQLKVAS